MDDDDYDGGPNCARQVNPWAKPKAAPWVRPDWWKDEYEDVPLARRMTREELERALKMEQKRLIERLKKHLADQSKPAPTPEQAKANDIKRHSATLARARTRLANRTDALAKLRRRAAELPATSYERIVTLPKEVYRLEVFISQDERTIERYSSILSKLQDTQ